MRKLALLLFAFSNIAFAATVATPTASPGAGTYTSAQSVTLSDATNGATICYTLNGSTPTASTAGTCDASSLTYSSAITISTTTTLNAIGTKAHAANSGILTAVYTINAGSSFVPTQPSPFAINSY